MKNIFIVFLLFLTGCQTTEYYSSDKILIKNIYKKDNYVVLEFYPVMESVYFVSGVNLDLNSDKTIGKLTFVRQFREGPKLKFNIPTRLFKTDSLYYMSINLPYSLKTIVITPPDTTYFVN